MSEHDELMLRHEMRGWQLLSLFGSLAGFCFGWIACFEGWLR